MDEWTVDPPSPSYTDDVVDGERGEARGENLRSCKSRRRSKGGLWEFKRSTRNSRASLDEVIAGKRGRREDIVGDVRDVKKVLFPTKDNPDLASA